MKRTELVNKWIEALRSGEYKQWRGGLRRDDCFCCLGVACDLSGFDKWTDKGNYQVYSESVGTLSPKDMQTLGISHSEQDVLIDMNDYQGKSFPEIADAIEGMIDE